MIRVWAVTLQGKTEHHNDLDVALEQVRTALKGGFAEACLESRLMDWLDYEALARMEAKNQ